MNVVLTKIIRLNEARWWCGLFCLSYKEHAWVTVAPAPGGTGETIVSFLTAIFFFRKLFIKCFSETLIFSRNLSLALHESQHCLGLVVEGNHKLVGSNKGSGDPFVENDQQIGAFSAGNHLPLAVQVRGGEVSQRKYTNTNTDTNTGTNTKQILKQI